MANSEKQAGNKLTGRAGAAAEARSLVRQGLKASLATLDHKTGDPVASLVTVATEANGFPLILISTLANHTRNLIADPRGSLLFDGTGGSGDPLEGARISVSGRFAKAEPPRTRDRFLARHPSAAAYEGFADFDFYRLQIEGAHFVGGFGRILDFAADELTIDISDAAALIEAESEIVDHMNTDHADATELYATRLLNGPPGPWRFAGCDPEGCDLVLGELALRLAFPGRVTSPQAVRKCLVALANEARR
ncbi:MAG: DUF2470 domain-containing protein [Hyphomicrobiales bacterium]|nr:DUF2470 domain-containing protein [Hyphomicrobiales bacterium]